MDDLFRAAGSEDYRALQNLATFEFDRSQILSYSISGFEPADPEEMDLTSVVNGLNEALLAHAEWMKRKLAYEDIHADIIKRVLRQRETAKIGDEEARVVREWWKLVRVGRGLIKQVSSARAKLNAERGAVELSVAGLGIPPGALNGTVVVEKQVAKIDVRWVRPHDGNIFPRKLGLELTRAIRLGDRPINGRWIATSQRWDQDPTR